MLYRAIGVVSGSSLHGLDIAFAELQEGAGKWSGEIIAGERIPYSAQWIEKLRSAAELNMRSYLELNVAYAQYLAATIHAFIEKYQLQFKVQIISCHGHTVVYDPTTRNLAVLGEGATIAALTGINVVSDVRNIDIALGGKGAPVFPVVEKFLFPQHEYFLHLGSVATLSRHTVSSYNSFDVCPCNKLLDMLVEGSGEEYDKDGEMATQGVVNTELLSALNALEFYHLPFPRTLSSEFSRDVLYPLISSKRINRNDALRTAVEHIAIQIAEAYRIQVLSREGGSNTVMISGGGGNNKFLVSRINGHLQSRGANLIVPDQNIVNFKEPLAMALMGVLRWREENNVYSYITGASRDSIGGAVWMGQEA